MKKRKTRIPGPVMKWQTGKFQRVQTFRFELPQTLLLLCKLADITPQQLFIDFMDNLSCGSWKREGRDLAKHYLIEYFIEHGYGRNYYSPDELRLMFKEMDAVGMLFPRDAEPDVLDTYSVWRENHQRYWFDKWINK